MLILSFILFSFFYVFACLFVRFILFLLFSSVNSNGLGEAETTLTNASLYDIYTVFYFLKHQLTESLYLNGVCGLNEQNERMNE